METQSSIPNVTGSTPGPWRVEDVGIPGTLAIMAGSTTEYRWIATVTEDMGSGVDWTQTQANARLMVASHDLYEALKDIVDALHDATPDGSVAVGVAETKAIGVLAKVIEDRP